MTDAFEADLRAYAANAAARPVRIEGGLVARPAGAATATVQDFLRYLRSTGLESVPTPVSLAGAAEVLRFLPGASGGDAWYHQHTDEGLASAARLLRRIHDAGQGWAPREDALWGAPSRAGDDVVYCHGDPGPWNFVWRDNTAVGLIDWDYLHPASRLDDIAYALRWFVPLRADEFALQWHHFPEVPDRRHRIRVFLRAYGDVPAFDVVEVVAARMQAASDLVMELAEAGQEPQRTWVADGAPARLRKEIAWLREHADLFADAWQ